MKTDINLYHIPSMTAILVEAMKEQNKEIEILRTTVSKLKTELKNSKKIAAKVDKLEALIAKVLNKKESLTASN